MRTHHNKPKNEQDFEILCVKLLRAHWKSDQVDLYSTRGEKQHGVDIIDLSGQDPLRAAQCKLHEEGKSIGSAEIEEEVNKAKGFKPPLGLYVVMTTGKAKKDSHDIVLKINQEHRQQGLFQVQLIAWNGIEELLDQYPDVRDNYEGGLSAATAARMDTRLGSIEVSLAACRADERSDKFHAEIDEARDYLNRCNYQMARLLLHRIRSHKWNDLNPRHKFRILTNLAAVATGEDDWNKAAELFLEAKTHQPEDEMAQANETLAYQILGDRQHAFALASTLKDIFPASERIHGMLVRNAPAEMTLEELEAVVPTFIATRGEAALALAERAVDDGRFTEAEKFARRATASHPTWSVAWLELGTIILEAETRRSWRKYGFGALMCEDEKLRETERIFTTALSSARAEGSKQRIVEALLNRSRVRGILGQEAAVQEDIEEAYRVAPDDNDVLVAYAQTARLQGDLNRAIEVLRRVPIDRMVHNGQMTLVMLLNERGSASDYREAAAICSKLARLAARMKEDFREHVVETALHLLAKVNQIETGHTLIDELPGNTVSRIGLATLRGKAHQLEGKPEVAASDADEALKEVTNETSPHDLRRLALLLSELGRHKDALGLWQGVAVRSVLSEDTRRLLECASRLGRHDVMLDTFQDLRSAGAVDRKMLENELSLLELYDTPSAIEVLKQEIAKYPGDRKLKLRLSVLGLALDRPELVDKELSSLPSMDEVSPRLGIWAVQVLRVAGRPMDAVQYAYEVLRRHFYDIDAHRALMAALAPIDPDPEIKKPEVAEVGTAVCYLEHGDQHSRWVIIEDSDNPDPKLDELPPEHALCKRMLGKKVGDKFTLAEGIQDRTAEIKEVLSKYVYRYQDCMNQWQVRFPDSRDVQMVRVVRTIDRSGEQEVDISAIKKSVDERYESVKKTQELYQSQLMPIHLVAEHFGKNVFEALHHLAYMNGVPIKCCLGSAEERAQAVKVLASSNTVVLDMSVISTLFLLDRLDMLENWPIDIVVSHGTMNELRQMIANESRQSSHESGVFMKTESGYGLVEQTLEQKVVYIDRLRRMVRILEMKCRVVSCRALAAVDPEKRDVLVKAFGQYGAESIVLASVPGAVLWTDDHIQAMLARGEHGVLRVWTQLVMGWRAETGAIDAETYSEASAKLAGFGYFFTSVNPQILRLAAIMAEWKIDRWPFSQVVEMLEQDSIDLTAAVQLVAGFLPLLYKEALLADTQSAVTLQMLGNLSKRKNGLAGIVGLRKALQRIFGLNVVGHNDAARTIDAWLDANSRTPFL